MVLFNFRSLVFLSALYSIPIMLHGNMHEYAVCLYPFIDLVGDPLPINPVTKSSLEAYAKLTIAPKDGLARGPRLHQLLYNEIVLITEERGDQIKIKIFNAWYTTEKNKHQQTEYWTHKQFLIRFSELEKHKISSSAFPQIISFQNKTIQQTSENVVTLSMPYTDPNGRTFCAGTRFSKIIHPTHRVPHGFEAVWYIHPETVQLQFLFIPKNLVCSYQSKGSISEDRNALITLLRQWCAISNPAIQYVLGGGSIMQPTKHHSLHNKNLWEKVEPYPGIDCSILLLRACQILGIPYYFKNTRTAALNMRNTVSSLEPGDIIWFPGHIMIISDNTHVIEARGYNGGFGKLQEIRIENVFKDIHSIEELAEKAAQKQIFYRLNSDKKPYEKITEVRILSLASVYYAKK